MLEISGPDHLHDSLERDRLDELNDYSIAGTEPEPRFDAIARAAGALLKAPMAFMTVVDADRQWFKAAVGADVVDTPRSLSFCTHTIMSDDVMVVNDATADPRFAENPMVTGEQRVRFYAGAPLITEKGFRLGALCVVDTVPREFTNEQRGALKDLAALAVHQISARRSEFSTIALAGLAQSLGQALLAVGQNGQIEFANRPASEFFGYELATLRGMRMDELITAGKLGIGADQLISVYQDARTGVVSRPLIRDAVKSDGSVVPVEISVSRWDSLRGTGVAVVLRDLAEKAASELNTLKAAGVGRDNDAVVLQVLDGLIEKGRVPGLFLVALDGFDALCENFGRNMGHTVLQSVRIRLHRLLPASTIIARTNGDDFAVIIDNVDDAAGAHRIAERLVAAFDEAFDLGVRVLQTSASIGFVVGAAGQGNARDLVANSAFALHAVRRGGGHGLMMYDERLRARSTERHQVQRELLQGLKSDQFRLFYQPQISLADGRIRGIEALIRWQHPTRGLLQPKDFLFDVEEGGLSLPIGWWTLEAAGAQLAAWRAEGLPPIRMGVNLFPAQFRSDKLVPYLVDLLERYDLQPGLLELEVTETIALLNDEEGLKSFQVLRNMGMGIAFDDFGTGYASLSSLQEFPLTTLKLDRGFIRNILTNSNDAVITRSMIAMANDLGLTTIAEGIETREQEALLRTLGCRMGQGYLYSKPISAEEMGLMMTREAGEIALAEADKQASRH